MNTQFKAPLFFLTAAAVLALGGCGDSTPAPASNPAANASATAPAQTPVAASEPVAPEQRAFASIATDTLKKAARISHDCSLDVVAGQAAGSTVLDRTASPLFSGWVADTATGAVPSSGQLVLKGAQDFALTFDTGSPPRTDVAKALNKPAFTASGYQVHGDLSSVAAGKYSVLILSNVAGQSLLCDTSKRVSVR